MFTVDNYQKSIFTVDLPFSNVEIPAYRRYTIFIVEMSKLNLRNLHLSKCGHFYRRFTIFTVDLPFLRIEIRF
jgi:hypothetical protein